MGLKPSKQLLASISRLVRLERAFTPAKIRAQVTAFMAANNVPGASLAIAYKGRLVFSEGYGYTDVGMKVSFFPSFGGVLSPRGLRFEIPSVPVTTNHLFRIASLSKPITSVAVFRLIEEGKLDLGERVFGEGVSGVSLNFERGILGNNFGTPPRDSLINEITVQHLLEHTSGWPMRKTRC